MTTPNPAGYYSLDIPENIDQETDHLSSEADNWINQRSPEQRIALIRWLAERLDYLAQGSHVKPQPN